MSRQQPPHEAGLLEEAEDVSREWLALPGRRERGFALGRFDPTYLAARPLVLMRDPRGRLVAFLNEVPVVRSGVATVDLMRHRRDLPNGLMDYLFSELMLRVHDEVRWFFWPGLFAGSGMARGSLPERIAPSSICRVSACFRSKVSAYRPVEPFGGRFLATRCPSRSTQDGAGRGRLTQGSRLR